MWIRIAAPQQAMRDAPDRFPPRNDNFPVAISKLAQAAAVSSDVRRNKPSQEIVMASRKCERDREQDKAKRLACASNLAFLS